MHRALVVEDDPVIRYILAELLLEEGFQVMEASSLSQARCILNKEAPDLITLDLNLAGECGIELLDEIRASRQLSATPVIVISANAVDLVHNANVCIRKPFDVEQVRAAIRRFSVASMVACMDAMWL